MLTDVASVDLPGLRINSVDTANLHDQDYWETASTLHGTADLANSIGIRPFWVVRAGFSILLPIA